MTRAYFSRQSARPKSPLPERLKLFLEVMTKVYLDYRRRGGTEKPDINFPELRGAWQDFKRVRERCLYGEG